MRICSSRNKNLLSRCVYSDILNRKFPPKKPFRPESSDCAECVTFSLPRIKFKLSSDVFFDGQQPEARPLPFLYALTPQEPLPNNAKSPLPVAVETPYLNQKRHAIFKRTDKIHHCGFEHGGFNVLYR